MERLNREGLARAIGVSNFYPDRLVDLIEHNEIVPAVNQIETHPFFQRTDDQEFMRERGVQIESWGPVRRRPQQPLLRPDALGDRRHARQVGRAGRPALADPARRRRHPEVGPRRSGWHENFDVFDFAADRRRDGAHRRARYRRVALLRPPRPERRPPTRDDPHPLTRLVETQTRSLPPGRWSWQQCTSRPVPAQRGTPTPPARRSAGRNRQLQNACPATSA